MIKDLTPGTPFMSSIIPTEEDLKGAIVEATEQAFLELRQRTRENFYYFSLITSGEGHSPFVSACSNEQLDRLPSERRSELKLSYADSPYCCFGDGHFKKVEELFAKRPSWAALNHEEKKAEYCLRINAMEKALAELDAKGLFGTGQDRERLVVNAEVMPPDHTNMERALRLNPPGALTSWLEEAAE